MAHSAVTLSNLSHSTVLINIRYTDSRNYLLTMSTISFSTLHRTYLSTISTATPVVFNNLSYLGYKLPLEFNIIQLPPLDLVFFDLSLVVGIVATFLGPTDGIQSQQLRAFVCSLL